MRVEVDGLQVIGVPYRKATQRDHLASVPPDVGLDRDRARVLLIDAPDYPAAAEAAGDSLQRSGHTHQGQFIPWSSMAQRM
jgi:predicted MPP superfamily phosphohydrolase